MIVGHWMKFMLPFSRGTQFSVLKAGGAIIYFRSKFCEYGVVTGSLDSESDCLELNLGSTSVTPGK